MRARHRHTLTHTHIFCQTEPAPPASRVVRRCRVVFNPALSPTHSHSHTQIHSCVQRAAVHLVHWLEAKRGVCSVSLLPLHIKTSLNPDFTTVLQPELAHLEEEVSKNGHEPAQPGPPSQSQPTWDPSQGRNYPASMQSEKSSSHRN